MTTVAVTPRRAATANHYRPALDGIRALAVGGVVVYHLGASWLPGGFLGVDMFFVLSGFLITGILLREIAANDRINFADFYARRARRLLPALYVLILAVCAWALFIAAPDIIGDLRGAALAALFYVANWFFIVTGQSYFDLSAGPSPLEHTWSLAIEEQYYLVWPLLLLFLVRKARPYVLTFITVVLIIGSVALMAITYDDGDPSIAYFGTFTRIHELLIGSLLAMLVHRGLTMGQRGRWTAWVALGLIALAMLTVSDTGGFYYRGGSLLFSIVVAWLLLAIGTGKPGGSATTFLSLPPLVWVGLISYGIYLWHWPLILWLNPISTGITGVPLALLRLGLTFGVATASYYLLERPIRTGSVFGYSLTPPRLAKIVPIAMAVMAVIIVASTARAVAPDTTIDETVLPTQVEGAATTNAPTVLIAGDSVPKEAMAYMFAEAKKRGWNVIPLAFGGCSITTTYQVNPDGTPFEWSQRCADQLLEIQQKSIQAYRPDVVLWYSNRERYPVKIGDQVLQTNTPAHRANLDKDLEAAYQRFTAGGAKLVIVLPVPKAPPTKGTCALAVGTDNECVTDDAYYASFAELTKGYEKLAAAHPANVRLVAIDDILCPDDRDCPQLMQGGDAVRPDGIHFSEPGALWFIPQLFDRVGILPRSSG